MSKISELSQIIKNCWTLIAKWYSSLNTLEAVGLWSGIITIVPAILLAVSVLGFWGSIVAVVIITLLTTISFLKKYCSAIVEEVKRPQPVGDASNQPTLSSTHPSSYATVHSKTPFQTRGTLSANAPSYIQRECDNQLATALETKTLIAITGEYQIGKSSLLMQVPTLAKVAWKDCFMDFQNMRTDHFGKFTEQFFMKIGKIFAGIESWEDLVKSLENQPIIFRFDEFGQLKNIASDFIPKLYSLYDPQSGVSKNIRIVVCSPEPIDVLLKPFKVDNPKYLSNWHIISVEPFTPEQTQQLLELLPPVIAAITRAQLNTILELSLHKPLALQRLCDRLFQAAQQKQIQSELITSIITNPNSYK